VPVEQHIFCSGRGDRVVAELAGDFLKERPKRTEFGTRTTLRGRGVCLVRTVVITPADRVWRGDDCPVSRNFLSFKTL
jgi:hypothetical protein